MREAGVLALNILIEVLRSRYGWEPVPITYQTDRLTTELSSPVYLILSRVTLV